MNNRFLLGIAISLQAIALIGIGRILFEPKVIQMASERGYIGCDGGSWHVKNIDFDHSSYKLPADKTELVYLDNAWCVR